MIVTLPPELEEFVIRQVESGLFPNSNEVIHEGLRLLRERYDQRLTALRQEIAVGIEQADRGELAPLQAMETLARVRKSRQDQSQKAN
jgi:putative addiction module CopG family antidote